MKVVKHFDETVFPYMAWIPEEVSSHPALIIQLHGAGERSSDPAELDKVLVHGFSKVATDENMKDCILVMPQCPEGSFWAAKVESLKTFIDYVAELYSADKNRIYLCGLSMGGFGTWYTAMAYPDIFAAIIPCCGGGMAWNAEVLTMPIWAFHGAEDPVVSPHQTMEMVEALKGINPNLRCTIYEGVGHESYKRAFSEELLQWLLRQHK